MFQTNPTGNLRNSYSDIMQASRQYVKAIEHLFTVKHDTTAHNFLQLCFKPTVDNNTTDKCI